LYKKTIETPDCDGVRILTIHKSKGLEFKHVIIPYCNWKLELKSTLWCKPQEAPFNALPVVPLNYTSVKAFENTIYNEVVTEEHVQNMVDNLNLLYVAMTRARNSLFVIGIREEQKKTSEKKISPYRSQKIEYAIRMMQKEGEEIDGMPLHLDIPDDTGKAIELTYGTIESIFDEKKKEKSQNVFLKEVEPVQVNIASYENKATFRQSNQSRMFADDAIDETDRQRYIRMGTVMHQIFSEINTTADVEPVLKRMEFDGTLYDEGITREKLISELERKFQDPQVKNWFSDKWALYNECVIINKDGEQRPDRVMTDGKETIVVDFKFGKPNKEYHEQVRGYMKLLEEMGMPGVKGYLWYVTLNKIEKV
jgi:ATP-dependent exoDNAse (exonuclease V) beta subunit